MVWPTSGPLWGFLCICQGYQRRVPNQGHIIWEFKSITEQSNTTEHFQRTKATGSPSNYGNVLGEILGVRFLDPFRIQIQTQNPARYEMWKSHSLGIIWDKWKLYGILAPLSMPGFMGEIVRHETKADSSYDTHLDPLEASNALDLRPRGQHLKRITREIFMWKQLQSMWQIPSNLNTDKALRNTSKCRLIWTFEPQRSALTVTGSDVLKRDGNKSRRCGSMF